MNSGNQEPNLPQASRKSKTYQFKALLQSTGWISPAFVDVDDNGLILSVSARREKDTSPLEAVNGLAVPGFQNAHSHAFQYAMAGTAERHATDAADDFWTWRQAMYTCALSMDPTQLQAVAAMVYLEMLRRGYTHVAEFQYLHHDKDGRPYGHLSEMSVSLVAAAAIAGIKITLIPVFYQKGGFGKDAEPSQRRFCFRDVNEYFKLLEECGGVVRNLSTSRLGFGVHSLRAANTTDLLDIVANGPGDIPFHIHASEQIKEVNDAIGFLKQRPVEWLLDNIDLNERFHLIHCTHLLDDEATRLAKSGAHVVLCPGTEANLGDGIFRLRDFAQHSQNWSIGTDSHISLNPLEDLRWLDYTQRLTTHRRNTFSDSASVMFRNTLLSGRRAMGVSTGAFFENGQPFDAVVYDGDSPLVSVVEAQDLLPTLVYTADSSAVIGTIVNGRWIIRGFRHPHDEKILREFQDALKVIANKK